MPLDVSDWCVCVSCDSLVTWSGCVPVSCPLVSEEYNMSDGIHVWKQIFQTISYVDSSQKYMDIIWSVHVRVCVVAQYYRLLLLSSFTSPLFCHSCALIFSFSNETERQRVAFLPPVNYPSVCPSVPLNWRWGDTNAVPVGLVRTMQTHWPALGSAKIELEIFHLLFSITKGVQGF